MKSSHYICLAGVGVCIAITGCASKLPEPTVAASTIQSSYDEPFKRADVITIEAVAEIVAIDHRARTMSLKGPDGKETSLTVPLTVTRFDEFTKGDRVRVKYDSELYLQADDSTTPTRIAGAVVRADGSTEPAVNAASAVHTSVKIVSVDKDSGTLAFLAQDGRTYSMRARDPKNLDRLHIGDIIKVTYSNAIAVSVEPAK